MSAGVLIPARRLEGGQTAAPRAGQRPTPIGNCQDDERDNAANDHSHGANPAKRTPPGHAPATLRGLRERGALARIGNVIAIDGGGRSWRNLDALWTARAANSDELLRHLLHKMEKYGFPGAREEAALRRRQCKMRGCCRSRRLGGQVRHIQIKCSRHTGINRSK
jgi:hypothetical protein